MEFVNAILMEGCAQRPLSSNRDWQLPHEKGSRSVEEALSRVTFLSVGSMATASRVFITARVPVARYCGQVLLERPFLGLWLKCLYEMNPAMQISVQAQALRVSNHGSSAARCMSK